MDHCYDLHPKLHINQPQGNNIQAKVVEMQFPRARVIKDKVHDKVQSQVKVVEVIQNKEWWIGLFSWENDYPMASVHVAPKFEYPLSNFSSSTVLDLVKMGNTLFSTLFHTFHFHINSFCVNPIPHNLDFIQHRNTLKYVTIHGRR